MVNVSDFETPQKHILYSSERNHELRATFLRKKVWFESECLVLDIYGTSTSNPTKSR